MDFFVQAVNVLKVLVMAIGAGLGAWGVINLLEGYGSDNPRCEESGDKATDERWRNCFNRAKTHSTTC